MSSQNYDNLLRTVYKDDPLFQKLSEIFDKYYNTSGLNGKHITEKKKNIYYLDIQEKFFKNYIPFLECLLRVDFKRKDCFKVFIVLQKKCLNNKKPYVNYRKRYFLKQLNISRMTFDRCIEELEEKNMLLVEKEDGFIFTPILAPLVWNVSEKDKEQIAKEIEREIIRLDKKWITKNI